MNRNKKTLAAEFAKRHLSELMNLSDYREHFTPSQDSAVFALLKLAFKEGWEAHRNANYYNG